MPPELPWLFLVHHAGFRGGARLMKILVVSVVLTAKTHCRRAVNGPQPQTSSCMPFEYQAKYPHERRVSATEHLIRNFTRRFTMSLLVARKLEQTEPSNSESMQHVTCT
mmetsp:Transcript_20505/g.34591  ORF Transcript_20505/g.34591 Transcript_20505/m.34591 type:complete len:109 (-) Transcript_20505:81-407(-)